MIGPREKLLLKIVGRPPGENGGHAQRLAVDLRPDLLGQHPFGRVLVVGTAGRVNVVIPGIPPVARGVDPASQPEQQLHGAVHGQAARLGEILGPPGHRHIEGSGRKLERRAVTAVDLRLEIEVRRQALGDARV